MRSRQQGGEAHAAGLSYMKQRVHLEGADEEDASAQNEFLAFLSSTNVGFCGDGDGVGHPLNAVELPGDSIMAGSWASSSSSPSPTTASASATGTGLSMGEGSDGTAAEAEAAEEEEEQEQFFDASTLLTQPQNDTEGQIDETANQEVAALKGGGGNQMKLNGGGVVVAHAGQERNISTSSTTPAAGGAAAAGRRARSVSRPRTIASTDDYSTSTSSPSLHRSLSIRSAAEEPVPQIPARFLNSGRPASIVTQGGYGSPQVLPVSRSSSTRLHHHRHHAILPAASSASPSPVATSTSTSTSTAAPAPSIARTSLSTLAPESAVPESQRRSSISPSSSVGPNAIETARGRRASRQGLQPPELHRRTPTSSVDLHTLSKLESSETRSRSKMSRTSRGRANNNNPDLFLDVGDARNTMPLEDEYEQLRRSESRVSQAGKRRSLPADMLTPSSDRRPSTSGNIYARPQSRLYTNSNRASSDLQRHLDQYRSPTARQFGDAASVSGLSTGGRSTRRFSIAPEQSPISPSHVSPLVQRERLRSSELREYRSARQSLGETLQNHSSNRTLDSHEEESPTDDSEPKRDESTSADSQTAETVWDELDDLKARIKKLEFTGKPPTSSAAASGDSSDRPRTATTAPTTIDSSPKHQRKQDSENKATPTPPPETPATPSTLQNVHPALHSALAKAKPLLNSSLFRTLEASANDAIQLAAMTSGHGPQGTNYSAASIINGAVSERQVKRKVDSMCRNLTDLCISLCEGKLEAPAPLTSPASMDTVTESSPSLRYSRSSNLPQRTPSVGRPMSRLDARRSSILGVPSTGSIEGSRRGSTADASGSEQESPQVQSYSQQRRTSRAPSSVLRSRQPRQEEASGEDDEPTIRPPSRAMTDIGALRAKSRVPPPERSPNTQRTPSLRESMITRRTNEAAYESNREYSTPRISSLSGSDLRRRRLYDLQQATPPVMEEEGGPDDTRQYSTPSHSSRRRITSSGQFSSAGRRTTGEFSSGPSRAASLNQRSARSVVVE